MCFCVVYLAQEIVLSDGDAKNVENISKSLELNVWETKNVSVVILKWGQLNKLDSHLESKFDIIIASDIIYNSSNTHLLLIDTISKLLQPGGKFFLFNPPRLTKLTEFLSLAQESQKFSKISMCEDYDNDVTTLARKILEENPLYEPEIHLPFLYIFVK